MIKPWWEDVDYSAPAQTIVEDDTSRTMDVGQRDIANAPLDAQQTTQTDTTVAQTIVENSVSNTTSENVGRETSSQNAGTQTTAQPDYPPAILLTMDQTLAQFWIGDAQNNELTMRDPLSGAYHVGYANIIRDTVGHATNYVVFDSGSNAGDFVLHGTALAPQTDISISFADMYDLLYQPNAGIAGEDTLFIRPVNDTLNGDWVKLTMVNPT